MGLRHRDKYKACRQGGNVIMEFALVMIAAIPMLFGLTAVGISLGRSIQAVQVTRDVAHMYGLGVDFTTPASTNVVASLAEDFNLDPASGNAVLMLSRVITVSAADCGTVNPCPNLTFPVFTHRIVIGNASLRSSSFGTPPPAFIAPNGSISAAFYLTDSGLKATGFETVLVHAPGEEAWLVEGFFDMPDLNFLSPGLGDTTHGTYVRAIF
jgi:hypothetical protein